MKDANKYYTKNKTLNMYINEERGGGGKTTTTTKTKNAAIKSIFF